jgi:hypothetical protein
MNDQTQAEKKEESKSSTEQPAASAYRRPRLLVVGSTRRTLNGYHGVGKEGAGQDYAPKT